MPELPEVETTLRGLKRHIINQKIQSVIVRFPKLRWPIPENLTKILPGKKLLTLKRRGKYLLFEFTHGTLILHLGMSGRLYIVKDPISFNKHDHVDIQFSNGKTLRFTDPRRFGCVLWANHGETHPLLSKLGPEPLSKTFTAEYLWRKTRNKKIAIKNLIMDAQIVVGVGNIYAAEALFASGINPTKPSLKVTRSDCGKLVNAIKAVLQKAIKKGGTTLRDFANADGKPGYFKQELLVYSREKQACLRCGASLVCRKIGQRSTVYCRSCQK